MMVPKAGLEPARYCYRGILSPLCLPIPPPGQFRLKPRVERKTIQLRSLKIKLVALNDRGVFAKNT